MAWECRSPSHSGWESGAGAHDRIAVAQPRQTSRLNFAGFSSGPVAGGTVLYNAARSQVRALRRRDEVKRDVVKVWNRRYSRDGNDGDVTPVGGQLEVG